MTIPTSKRLLANSNKIIERWKTRAKSEIQAATNQDSLLLVETLNEQIAYLADALNTKKNLSDIRVKWNLDESKRLGKLHGGNRANQAFYTIDQIIFEFHILRQVVCEVMDEELPLTNMEREIITCAIEQAVNDAATEFSATQTSSQQQMIHTMAHDLRGPVTAAKMISQQVQRQYPDNEFCNAVAKRVSKNMDKLDLMIKDLLDAGRLRAGESLPLELKECDLNEILTNTVEDLNFIYSDRFKYISSGECQGLWNAKGLQRLIENLATNAIKYGSLDSDITITLDQTGKEILICVHNEGGEIPPEEQKTLFQQYRRMSSSKGKLGWGLGLAIVQAIAKAHNGSVEVKSIKGRGTTFIVKFPKPSAFSNIQYTQNSSHSTLPV